MTSSGQITYYISKGGQAKINCRTCSLYKNINAYYYNEMKTQQLFICSDFIFNEKHTCAFFYFCVSIQSIRLNATQWAFKIIFQMSPDVIMLSI